MRFPLLTASFLRLLAAFALVFALGACESSEERAEAHFQSGLALIAEGDTERALVEFRNVFKLNGTHRGARQTYARLVRDQGKFQEAYGQYLRLVEQYPEDAEGRVALAEMSFRLGNWEEFVRHGAEALKLLPDDPRVRIIDLGLQFRQAALDEDGPKLSALTETAAQLARQTADSQILHTLLVDGYLRDGRYAEALAEVEAIIAQDPENRQLYNQKLALLNQLGDMPALEAELVAMVDRFPADNAIKQTLIRFYMSRAEIDKAEAFLRRISKPGDEDPALYLSLVQFLLEQRGANAALAELDAGALAAPANGDLLRSIRAGIDFQEGRRDKAVADLETLLKGAEPSDQTDRIRVALARMLLTMGNEVGARQMVDQVLAHDAGQIEALKMQAAWAIEGDSADDAIATLRTVLDQSPQDAQAMVLMAQAYTRAGSHELARDFLSLSVEASGNAPEYALRYAQLLISEDRLLPAEDTLIASLRSAPDNVDVLALLGQVYLRTEDMSRATQVVQTLRRIGTEPATRAAQVLDVNLLGQRDGTSAAIEVLEQMANEGGDISVQIAVIQGRLNAGQTAEALEYAKAAVADNPDNTTLKFVLHATQAATGALADAEAGYKELLALTPDQERVWLALARVQNGQGRPEDAAKTLAEGLAANPDAPNLLWGRASQLERDGDIDGAIEIYDSLYKTRSSSMVVANNLASLLSTYRTSPEDLERAYAVARRLRGTNVAPFQDTYGWIMYRRGDYEEALRNLEPAAQALTTDPLVQYHLGMTYLALDRVDDARRQLQMAVDVAGPVDTRPQIDQAREELRKLAAKPSDN